MQPINGKEDHKELKKEEKKEKRSWFSSLFSSSRPLPEQRVLYMDGSIHPHSIKEPNLIMNSKYTFFTFLPLVLYNQFKYFFNLFYLLIALSQFINMLKVGFLFTYVAPLAFVLAFTLFKQAMDDYYRKKRDRQTNYQTYNLITKTGVTQIYSKDLKVGHII